MHRHFSFLIMFRVCIFKKSTFCGYLATFSGHIRHSAAICCHFATSLRDEKHKQWCFHLFLLCNSLPFLGLMTDPFQLFSYIWKEIVVPSLLLWGCSGQLKEDRILSLYDLDKCFLKLKGGWSVEGKDGFWYFLSKPQQMIARKAAYPSAPLLLFFIIIIIITTINHIDIIIITIKSVFITHRHQHHHHYHHHKCKQTGDECPIRFFGFESVKSENAIMRKVMRMM